MFSGRLDVLIDIGKKIISTRAFKKIHTVKPIYSVRIGIGWRSLGVKTQNDMIWFWIASHAEYDSLIRYL